MAEELTITAGGDRVAVAPRHGGRLSSLIAGGRERLVHQDQAREAAPDLYWGAYLMAPWPGRLDHGRYPTPAREYTLDPVLDGHAIHGVAWMRGWEVDDHTATSVTLSCPLDRGGWPLGGRAIQALTLSPGVLELEATVEGLTTPGPVGLGWHPWFRRPSSGDMTLRVPASHRLEVRDDAIPTGRLLDVDGPWDLRDGPELGPRRIDVGYAGCEGPIEITWPDLRLHIAWGPQIRTVVVYTPPDGLCVEPQSMWPNAPLLAAGGVDGTGEVVIGPGDRFAVHETWSWEARG